MNGCAAVPVACCGARGQGLDGGGWPRLRGR
jgi:hypothetical protein